MKFLIAGLGNIGAEYADTRHNIGFGVVDFIAAKKEITFASSRHAYVSEFRFRGKTVFLIKPTTYMNLSGKAVNYWLQAENIPKENLLVFTDDIALPFGIIRLRAKGSDGGHNGLKSIAESINGTDYARARFGVGNDFGKGQQVNYVLGKWNADEIKLMPERLQLSYDLALSFIALGVTKTMNDFNNK
jgi:peptidyl-tRNA hydrolase, PTH1 family